MTAALVSFAAIFGLWVLLAFAVNAVWDWMQR
jgi:hypothetical protein